MCRVDENSDCSSPDCKPPAQEGWQNAITPVKMPIIAMVKNVEKLLGRIMSLLLGMKSKNIPGPSRFNGGP